MGMGPGYRPGRGSTPDSLEGVSVIELGGYAAGPAIGKYLANFGALVIHVESMSRPDGFRLQYPPFKDGKVDVNGSGCFAIFNDSKYGVTLNLKHPDGLELARRLIDQSDIVVENMRPGAIGRLGLDYASLKQRNPRLIMLSTSNMGQTGPYAAHPGFGSQLSSFSGFTELIGEADGPPQFLYGPYIDLIAVAFGGAAVLAALDHQRRTGEGVFIDISQLETGLQFISGPLLDYGVNGMVARRDGNRDLNAVPHGCYECREQRWCVISCWNVAEWARLCLALGRPEWTEDPRFAGCAERRQNEIELNRLIADRVRHEDAADVADRLQADGIHAAVVQTVGELFSDPQLLARNTWQAQEHPVIGTHHYRMVSYELSETPGRVRSPAPCLGQHNKKIFCEWLGLDPTEYEELQRRGAFS